MLGIYNYLWRLIPANPILLRVVETGGKRRRDLFIRCAYLGLLVAFVIISLMSGSSDQGSGSLAGLAKTSANLFQKMSYLQLGLVALLAPVFTAGAITQEKDSQTYDILLATPLNNGQIVLGSLLSRLFFVIALLVSGIPIFSITQIFGGVAIKSIVLSFGIAAATAFATGALAMAIATFKVGTRRTIFSFYLFIVIYMAGGIVLDQFPRFQVAGPTNVNKVAETTQERPSGDDVDPAADSNGASASPVAAPASSSKVTGSGHAHISWFTGMNPFLSLRVLFRSPEYAPPAYEDLPPELQRWPVGWYLSNPAGFYITFMLVFSLVLVMPSIILLRRMAQSTTSVKTLILQKLKISTGDRTRKPRSVWANPIAWREARTKASAAKASFLRYSFILVGLVVAIALLVQYTVTSGSNLVMSPSDYDAKAGTIKIPSESGHAAQFHLMRDWSLKVTLHYGGEEGAKPFNLRDFQSPMEVVEYDTYRRTDQDYRDNYEVQQAVQKYGEGKVLKSLELRPVSRGVDAWLLRKYLLGACAVEFAVILLIVTNAAASTVTREKEDGTLDLLLSSPITSRYYIWGKLRGLVSFVLPLVAVPVISVGLFLLYDIGSALWSGASTDDLIVFPESVVLLPAVLVIVCAFAAILGMQMSLRCRTTVMAVMSSVGIVVGICALMGWCGFAFLANTRSSVPLAVGAFSPFTLMQMLIDRRGAAPELFGAGIAEADVNSNRTIICIFTLIAVGIYVAVVWNMYTGMVKNFDMTIRKQSR